MKFNIQNLIQTESGWQFDGVCINQLASEFDTPLYVYSLNTINKKIADLKNTFSELTSKYRLFYAVKANSNLKIIKHLANAGFGFDIVSAGELMRVKKAVGTTENVVFAGVGKTAFEIKLAVNSGIHAFNVESIPELEHIGKICQELGKKANITFRINPNVDAHTHAYITTGTEKNKFGIMLEHVDAALDTVKKYENLNFIGYQMHLGSQIKLGMPYRLGFDVLKTLINKAKERELKVEEIDLGGGFGVGYEENEDFNLVDFIKQMKPYIPEDITISAEPGRYIVAESGILLTKVLYRKSRFVIVDGAMTECVRPTLYGAYHPIANMTKGIIPETDEYTKIENGEFDKTNSVDIVGPVCESGDFLGLSRNLEADQGDILAVLYAGAYGYAMSSNYNSRPKPAEVLVENGVAKIISKRESLEELFRNELLDE